jgi:nucleoside-diphosphate-sugar epimerase
MSKTGATAVPEPVFSAAPSGEGELDDILSSPSDALVQFIRTLSSPLLVLGAGGKMGPTLAVLAKRAAAQANHNLEVIAVSRFTDANARALLEREGVRTISCDLLDRAAIAQLPDSLNIIYLVGLKFGTARNPATTWAMNTLVPANVVERYPESRIVALSTGNVYPLSAMERGGSREEDPLTPVGEYPNAAVARERLFEFCAARHNTKIALLRLFYAVELRYGVLVDLAQKIVSGEPIDLATGFFNYIWQRDANDMIIRALSLTSSPPSAWNLCHPQIFRVRDVACELGEMLGERPIFKNTSNSTALLGSPKRICEALGTPPTPPAQALRWTADWVKRGGRNLGRPTHFEVRDGVY